MVYSPAHLSMIFGFLFFIAASSVQAAITTNYSAAEIASRLNLMRTEHGLTPLHPQDQLDAAAQTKAEDILVNRYWSHDSNTQKTPWQFIAETGYTYQRAGENLARNYQDAAEVITAWFESPSHRANMLEASYEEIGIGIAQDSKTIIVVAIFATPQQTATTENQSVNYLTTKLLNSPLQPEFGWYTLAAIFSFPLIILIVLKFIQLLKYRHPPHISLWRHP